jgi:hypothetical protein
VQEFAALDARRAYTQLKKRNARSQAVPPTLTRRDKMNSLPTTGQARTWTELNRRQLVSAIVLLALLATMTVALVGATIYVGERAYSSDNSSLIAGGRRNCPCV